MGFCRFVFGIVVIVLKVIVIMIVEFGLGW